MNDGSSTTFLLIFMGLAIVAMLFMSSRARKRQAEATSFRSTLQPGQRVMTTSGMFGTVVAVDGDKVTISTLGGQESEWLLVAIAKLVEDEPAADDDELAATDGTGAGLQDEAAPPTDLGTNPLPPRDDTAR
ncbi:preprotein translocase subunit YajC [Pseudactinotalea suaedae]|uniref:preprotein translocase subunit YajC n=1 Tax=Pseudactinotalea suaedae TaxID=1524924 RepID=UPI0012E31DAB|nr:preprotein translocase subunit YajC [Pseudactinotalea suaedae]